jgi:hypothetical protein
MLEMRITARALPLFHLSCRLVFYPFSHFRLGSGRSEVGRSDALQKVLEFRDEIASYESWDD